VLSDEKANEVGKSTGDDYFADLDFALQKEGYESDVPSPSPTPSLSSASSDSVVALDDAPRSPHTKKPCVVFRGFR